MEANNEKPIIFAVVTVFLTFTLVYLAFFRTQWWSLLWSESDDVGSGIQNTSLSEETLTISWVNDLDTILNNDGWVELPSNKPSTTWTISTGKIGSWISTPLLSPQNKPQGDATSLLKKKIDSITTISPRYNSIKIAETLALDIKFAFSDTGSIQYGYLGTGSIDSISSTVKRLWWNLVAIETENDILKNSLRWDRILFINIPQVTLIRTNGSEKRLLVAFVVEIDSDKWLIQAPADRYYVSKQRMKSLFEQIYGKML
jgi:hypothetical protein